jgi:hypothetical protein
MPIGAAAGNVLEHDPVESRWPIVASWFETRGFAALLTMRV